jgi:hypothetical protein
MRAAVRLVLLCLVAGGLAVAVAVPAVAQSVVAHGGRSYLAIPFRDLESHFCREAFCWFGRDRSLVGRNVVTSCFVSGRLWAKRAQAYGFICDNGRVNVFTHRYIYVVAGPEVQDLYMRENDCGVLPCEFVLFGTVEFGKFTGPVPTPHMMMEGVVTGHSLRLRDMRRTGRRVSAGQLVGDVIQQFRTLCSLLPCGSE